jgi:hypothetical protein
MTEGAAADMAEDTSLTGIELRLPGGRIESKKSFFKNSVVPCSMRGSPPA